MLKSKKILGNPEGLAAMRNQMTSKIKLKKEKKKREKSYGHDSRLC